jgi:hypothetical protein
LQPQSRGSTTVRAGWMSKITWLKQYQDDCLCHSHAVETCAHRAQWHAVSFRSLPGWSPGWSTSLSGSWRGFTAVSNDVAIYSVNCVINSKTRHFGLRLFSGSGSGHSQTRQPFLKRSLGLSRSQRRGDGLWALHTREFTEAYESS